MIQTQIIEIPESDHGLIGLGIIKYTYKYNSIFVELKIHIESVNQEIILSGDEAKNKWFNINDDSDKSIINHVKKLAADSCGISFIKLKDKCRDEELVWARYLVMWYAKKYLNYSFNKAGKIFGKGHSLAIHAYDEIKKEDRHIKNDQRIWRNIFLRKLKEYDLI